MIHITLTEVITSLVLYICVHSCLWVAKNAERFITTHADHILRQHVLHGHKQKASLCAEDRCGELATLTSIDSMTI